MVEGGPDQTAAKSSSNTVFIFRLAGLRQATRVIMLLLSSSTADKLTELFMRAKGGKKANSY